MPRLPGVEPRRQPSIDEAHCLVAEQAEVVLDWGAVKGRHGTHQHLRWAHEHAWLCTCPDEVVQFGCLLHKVCTLLLFCICHTFELGSSCH